MRWLLLEPYHDGSHRALIDGLVKRVVPDAVVHTLPARKWKWRMRGAALEFARRIEAERPEVDAVFASSMLNAAELRGLRPEFFARRPLTVYFHENQLAYPVQHFDKRDHHFAFTHLHTALAADRLLFNSAHNRDTLVGGLRTLARKMPDLRPMWAIDRIEQKAEVLPVPIAPGTPPAESRREGPCHLVWNHRWEFDKGPRRLLAVVGALEASGVDYALSVLGQSFRETPPVFEEIRRAAGDRIRRWGFVEDRREYLRILATADVALSTARHEFQGLATLEAAAQGAWPLVPDDLVYPEIWPVECRAAADELGPAAVRRARLGRSGREEDARRIAAGFSWDRLGPRWREVFAAAP